MLKPTESIKAFTMTGSRKWLESEPNLIDQKKEFEALFEQHWKRVWAVAYRLVGDANEAQDVALEAFIRLYQSPPNEQENIAGWLYRVTMRLGLNTMRARHRQEHYEILSENSTVTKAAVASPEEIFEAQIEREDVRRVLGKMKPRSAHILVLRSVGFSYAEIAESLAVSPGSVGTLLVRAQREFERTWKKLSHL
jgi:RNA polymerase sigma-70 factor, ECF subfamily